MVVLGLAILDSGMPEPAPALERGAALLASALVAGSWYAGVLEQFARRLSGQKLLGHSPN
jgi:hypothetical protein